MTTPAPDRSIPPRLADLPAPAVALVAAGGEALARRQAEAAERHLRAALVHAPRHAEVLRLLAMALHLQQRDAEALVLLRRAAAARPDDALIHNGIGTALAAQGDVDGAIVAFRRACELAPQAGPLWANLGKSLSDSGRFEEAVAALERAVALTGHDASRLRLAYALRVLGRTDAAAAEYRKLIARNPADGHAWLGLAGLRTRPFSAADIAALERALATAGADEDNRISLEFSLAKALEDHARYEEAFARYREANARVRRIRPWSAADFRRHIDAVLAAFAEPPAGATTRLGEEVIFIVSLPRSGSSLIEQMLASHPQVVGGGELDDLPAVIAAESERRGQPFPQWVARATPGDWERLGREYLARTARWRRRGMRFTDKLPGNWPRVGAILAMLPGARIVDCRRDPVEACLSCFRTLFAQGVQEFSYDLADLAEYWRDYDRAVRHWQVQYPDRVRVQVYEELVAEPERQIRELLDFCGLPFEEACLHFHATERHVSTPSASQVREPLRRDTARAPRYGALLDPLRAALGLAPFAA